MAVTERLAPRVEREAIERLGLLMLALGPECAGQIIDRGERVGVARAEVRIAIAVDLAQQRLCLLALLREHRA